MRLTFGKTLAIEKLVIDDSLPMLAPTKVSLHTVVTADTVGLML